MVDGNDAGECDPGFIPSGNLCVEATGQLDVAWDPEPDCPEGATTTQVVSSDESGFEFVDIYWCDDFSGVTGPLPLGNYEVFVNLTDTDELELFAQSFVEEVGLFGEGETATLDFGFVSDRAFIHASWTVVGGCQAAGIATVELVSDGEVLASAGCSQAAFESEPVALGERNLYLRTLEADGTTIISTTAVQVADLEFGNQLIDLGSFEF